MRLHNRISVEAETCSLECIENCYTINAVVFQRIVFLISQLRKHNEMCYIQSRFVLLRNLAVVTRSCVKPKAYIKEAILWGNLAVFSVLGLRNIQWQKNEYGYRA